MDELSEVMSIIGIEYFLEEVCYSFDLEGLNMRQYPHTNSILKIDCEFLN